MIDIAVQNRTGLSPEWDRWFDEEFTDLVASDEELLRAEFDELITSSWPQPPSRPASPAPPGVDPRRPTPTWEQAEPPIDPGPAAQPHPRSPP
jgi:hypothetical protein